MSWIDRPSSRPDLISPAAEFASDARERLARWFLNGPLVLGLLGLCLFQFATWVPHYLTWPLWADHDAYATMARGWNLGKLPYRDHRCNNFPGQVYVFWMLGKAFGWGKALPFLVVDVSLLLGLGALLCAWSRKRLGGILPGLVGYLGFLSYYLGLDYSHTAQRDWHGPLFAAAGLLVVQAWPSRAGRIGSALALATAFTFRPQTILFSPALALAVFESAREPGESPRRALRALAGWALAASAFVLLAFTPLLAAGVFGDFVRGVRLAAYGSPYNRATPARIAWNWFMQVTPLRVLLVPAAVALLAPWREPKTRAMIVAWLGAFAAVSLYKPLSPLAHTYLDIPLRLVWTINLALLAALVLEAKRSSASIRLAAVLAILSMVTAIRPDFCVFGPTARAFAALRRGDLPEEPPPGYRKNTTPKSTVAYYPWSDYRALITYLRRQTSPTTRVANALKGDPAVTAPADRLPAFQAEAVSWLRMVRPQDETDFAAALEANADSVVVWAPSDNGPDPDFHLDRLRPVIRHLYEPAARFGVIEVWRRKPGAAGLASWSSSGSAAGKPTPLAHR